jgi:type I restriction enzyme S subunit
MSFPKYPEYKSTGFDWLGDVPRHWSLKRLGHFVEERREKASDKEFAPLSVTKQGVVPRLDTAAKTQDGDNRKRVYAGDFVINSRSDRKGSSGLAHTDGTVSLICIVLHLKKIEPYYIHHLLRSTAFQEEFYRNGKGIVADLWSTGFQEMKNIILAVPPHDEQRKIAAFLDQETAKIDALIDEQKRLIKLLKEKRQAVISQAVTKGLDPNAPMKDSGVEWLGEVPAHWAVSRLGHYARILNGYAFPSASFSDDDSDVKLLRGVNVGVSRLRWDDTAYWQYSKDQGLDRYLLSEGQIVLGMDRPWIGGGLRVVRVRKTDMPCLLLQRVAAIFPNEKLVGDYLLELLSSDRFKAYVEPDMTGVSVPHISPEQVLGFVISMPPVEEQRAISEFLASALLKIEGLLRQSDQSIRLLSERRTALISAAVTGKIDVRDWKPPLSTTSGEQPVLDGAPA